MAVQVKCFPWGALVRLTAEFRDVDGDLGDPDSIEARTRDPDGAFVRKTSDIDDELVRDSVGLYHYDVLAETPGPWQYRWTGTGAITAAAEGRFTVAASDFEGGSP